MSKEYIFDAFTTNPPGCAVTYSYSTNANLVISEFSSSERKIVFFWKDDFSFCGDSSKDWTVSISGSTGLVTSRGASAEFTLTLKNPCGDPNLVELEPVALPTNF